MFGPALSAETTIDMARRARTLNGLVKDLLSQMFRPESIERMRLWFSGENRELVVEDINDVRRIFDLDDLTYTKHVQNSIERALEEAETSSIASRHEATNIER